MLNISQYTRSYLKPGFQTCLRFNGTAFLLGYTCTELEYLLAVRWQFGIGVDTLVGKPADSASRARADLGRAHVL